jgi:hypothetical protein
MAQAPLSKMSRQVRRAHERSLIRRTMSKTERRQYLRLPKAVRREIYYATLQMIAEGQLQARE